MRLSNSWSNIPFSSAAMSFFSWDLASDRVYGDAVLAELFDIDATELAAGFPILPMIERIASEDRSRIAESIHHAITTGLLYREQYSIIHPKRGKIRVLAVGRCLKTTDGVPFVYNGTVAEMQDSHLPVGCDPLRIYCQSALELAEKSGNELAARYLSSALRVIAGT